VVLEGMKLLFCGNRSACSREKEKGFIGFTEICDA